MQPLAEWHTIDRNHVRMLLRNELRTIWQKGNVTSRRSLDQEWCPQRVARTTTMDARVTIPEGAQHAIDCTMEVGSGHAALIDASRRLAQLCRNVDAAQVPIGKPGIEQVLEHAQVCARLLGGNLAILEQLPEQR